MKSKILLALLVSATVITAAYARGYVGPLHVCGDQQTYTVNGAHVTCK